MLRVMVAWIAGCGICALSAVFMSASGVEGAHVIIGSVLLGVATMLGVALALDR